MVLAYKAANSIVVVCQLHEKTVVNSHSNDLPCKFAVNFKERQDKLPTMYWLPKLHKRPYKARFIGNSRFVLQQNCKDKEKMFWSIKNSDEVLSKQKSRGYHATSLSTYDFSTLYTT